MRLAVLGSPIAHSLSPRLHGTAYRLLGLDWRYEAVEVSESALSEFVLSRGPEWRGLSLTMPLKQGVLPLLDESEPLVALTGAANTVVFEPTGEGVRRRGLNTDVYGITEALRRAGVERMRTAEILGGGATAASALTALAELGAHTVRVLVRTPERARSLEPLAARLGVALEVDALDAPAGSAPDVVVSTLPTGVVVPREYDVATRRASVLFDVAYHPWPSVRAEQWLSAGGRVVSGLEMLLHQAIAQMRVFVGGDREAPLPDEPAIEAALRAEIGAPAAG